MLEPGHNVQNMTRPDESTQMPGSLLKEKPVDLQFLVS